MRIIILCFQCHGRHLMCSFQFHMYKYTQFDPKSHLGKRMRHTYNMMYSACTIYVYFIHICIKVIASEEAQPPLCADRNVMLKNIGVFDEGPVYSNNNNIKRECSIIICRKKIVKKLLRK